MNKTSLSAVVIQILFHIQLSAQKIVLHLDATPSSTPSVSKAALRYNKDFAYSFTLDDCTIDHYTIAKPFFHGGVVPNSGYTSSGLFLMLQKKQRVSQLFLWTIFRRVCILLE